MDDIQDSNYSWIYAIYNLTLSGNKKTWSFYVKDAAMVKMINGYSQNFYAGFGTSAKTQYNLSTATYHVLAIGYKEET